MKINKKLILIIIAIVVIGMTLVACTKNNSLEGDINNDNEKIKELEEKIQELEEEIEELATSDQEDLPLRALRVIEAIEDKDMDLLSEYTHPDKGLRLTPYDFINLDSDQVFTPEEVKNLDENDEKYIWGSYDGTGDPINLTFDDYYEKFIYDEDFANPQIIGNNVSIGRGNTINNIEEAYPNAHFIELHFSGIDPEYAGIDWRSLKLVFEEVNDIWYLVGIVHGEWTI